MKPISEAIACVVDSGLFPHIATCLAQKFKHVYYVGPHPKVMPVLADAIVGDGFDKMTRVDSLWDVKGQSDVFCFPDIGFAGEQKELVSQGLPVWGHHGADELESRKGLFLKKLAELKMEVPEYTEITGMAQLREFLYDREDVYIKVSRFRGDWETAHWRNRQLDQPMLDCAAYRLGPTQDLLTFYVFEKIDSDVEDGIDAWRVGGKWPKRVLHAMEKKDKSLLGAMQDYTDISEEVRGVNDTFGPALDEYGYQGAFSTEVRPPYFIDPTCRFGSPPSQLQTALITNLAEVIYHGAHGEMVEPENDDPIGAQALITSDREKEEWLPFPMPEELRPWIKAAFSCEVEGIFTIAPNPLENWAGWLVATGPSIEDTIQTLKERKEMLPDGFDCDLTSLCDLLRELEDAKDMGIKITEQPVPEPSTVIQ